MCTYLLKLKMTYYQSTFFRNGEEWWRLRRAFQRGLSSPKCVQTFLPFTNEITDEWIQHLKHKLKDPIPNEDLFDDLTRLFLERKCFNVKFKK